MSADDLRYGAAERLRVMARQMEDRDPPLVRVMREAADLLDPQPPSLREQVAHVMFQNPDAVAYAMVDTGLAVVADAFRTLPQVGIGDGSGQQFAYRCDDVERLLRGAS